ncbi:MAG: flagellar hook capping protein [Syntrophaceae bacterium]|nr:flagellar hook capping protein [Syntrophaceae bacterium]
MATVSNVLSGLASNIKSSTTTTAKSDNTLGQDAFMTMLIAELKSQDPLNPMEGKDFAAQLAQFSSLQQLSNLNTTMSNLPSYLQAFSNAQMAGLIGDEATASGDTVTVSGSATNIAFKLPSNIAGGTLKIYNSSGSQVGSADLGSLKAGINSVAWNTSNVNQGNYTYEISAVDKSGNAVTAEKLISGTVTGVTFKNDTAYLTINGQEVAFSNIMSINKSTD